MPRSSKSICSLDLEFTHSLVQTDISVQATGGAEAPGRRSLWAGEDFRVGRLAPDLGRGGHRPVETSRGTMFRGRGALCQVAKWGCQHRLKTEARQRPEARLGCGLGSAGVGLSDRGFIQGNLGRSWAQKSVSKALKDELKGVMVEEGPRAEVTESGRLSGLLKQGLASRR